MANEGAVEPIIVRSKGIIFQYYRDLGDLASDEPVSISIDCFDGQENNVCTLKLNNAPPVAYQKFVSLYGAGLRSGGFSMVHWADTERHQPSDRAYGRNLMRVHQELLPLFEAAGIDLVVSQPNAQMSALRKIVCTDKVTQKPIHPHRIMYNLHERLAPEHNFMLIALSDKVDLSPYAHLDLSMEEISPGHNDRAKR